VSAPPALAGVFPEAADLGRVLVARGLRIGVAESCTGGLLGAVLTSVPGSSRYVEGGVIAYSNRVKTTLLGVDAGLIAEHGAVSEEVARAMALGCVSRLGVDVGIAITGVAGPAADDTGRPAGRIFVAVTVATAETTLRVQRLDGDSGREANRAGAVRAAIRLCADALTA